MFFNKRKKPKKEPQKPGKDAPLLRKIWYFIWYEDSILSWLVNVILAYIIIKFLFYPAIGFLFGTSYPIVAVVSGSMDHSTAKMCMNDTLDGRCTQYYDDRYEICGRMQPQKEMLSLDEFWDICGDAYMERNISRGQFDEFPFKNGFKKGDIMILFGTEPKDIKVGDVIVFQSGMPYPIIHRVISAEDKGAWVFETKGDHNAGQIRNSRLDETRVLERQVLGKAVLKVPWLGYIKIWFVDLLNLAGIQFEG